MNLRNFLIALFTFYFLILIFISPVFAQDNLGQARISPASPLYFLKSVREIIELKFAPTTHIKSLRYLEFSNRRIREARSLVKTSHEELIQPTLEKYWFDLGQLINIADLRDEDQAGEVTVSTNLQMSILQEIFSQVSDLRAKRSLRTMIFRLSDWDNALVRKLNAQRHPVFAKQTLSSKLSGCRFLSREASSSALNDTEKIVFHQRAKMCLNDLASHNNPEADQPQQ